MLDRSTKQRFDEISDLIIQPEISDQLCAIESRAKLKKALRRKRDE
jgi:hypothetical protein